MIRSRQERAHVCGGGKGGVGGGCSRIASGTGSTLYAARFPWTLGGSGNWRRRSCGLPARPARRAHASARRARAARARAGRTVRARPLGARLQRAMISPAALGPRRAAPSGRRWVLERSRRAGRGLSGSVRDRSGERGEQWAPARCLRPIARANACSDALGAQNPPRRAISRSATRILAE